MSVLLRITGIFLVLILGCYTWCLSQVKLTVQAAQVPQVVYANQASTSIRTTSINTGTASLPPGAVLQMMISVDGDVPTPIAVDTLPLDFVPYVSPGNLPGMRRLQLDNLNYQGLAARMTGGGGVVHVITIWPLKVGGPGPNYIPFDTFKAPVFLVDRAAFNISINDVIGLPSQINFDQNYNATISTTNVGISPNVNPLEFYAQLDNFPAVKLDTIHGSVPVNGSRAISLNNLNISSLYPRIPMDQEFVSTTHQLYIFAKEKGYENSLARAYFQVNVNSGQIFPVTLQHFGGRSITDGIELNWVTGTEENNDYFILEKFDPALGTYQPIHREQGAGFSNSPKNYRFLDPYPFNGTNQYQLRQIDLNGASQLVGNVVEVNFRTGDQFQVLDIYPNPVVDKLSFRLKMPYQDEVNLEILDLNGQVVLRKSYFLHGGIVPLEEDLSWLPAGVYVFNIAPNSAAYGLSGKIEKL
ncbi:MAG: T9SS type A sorting domain-containing protein [Bacteroidota bacterium]